MMPLSAIDAVSPALERAQKLLGRPFSVKRFVKLGLMAYAGVIGGIFLINIGEITGVMIGSTVIRRHTTPAMEVAMVAGCLVFAALGVGVLYLSARTQLAELWVIATGDANIGRAWTRSRRAAWRYCLVCLAWTAVLVLIIGTVAVIFSGVIVTSMKNGGQPRPELMLPLMFGMWAAIIPAVFVMMAVQIFIHDFLATPLLFEDASLKVAWQQGKEMVRKSPGQCSLFLLMYLLLSMIVGLVAEMGLFIVLAVSAIPGALIAFAVYELTKNVGDMTHTFLVIFGVSLAGLWIFFLMFVFFGAVQIVMQCYAVYFVGSRNRVLGDMLQPPAEQFPA